MNPREIVLQAIQPKPEVKTPRLPAALLSAGTWTFRQRGLTLKDVLDNPAPAAQIIVEVNEEIQSDIVWPGSGYHNLLTHLYGGRIKFRPQGNIDVIAPAFDNIAAAEKIESQLSGIVPIKSANTLNMAVQMASEEAAAGDVVLLAPACASFDQFTSYEHRGRTFVELVHGLEAK